MVYCCDTYFRNGCWAKSDLILLDYGEDVRANNRQPITHDQLSSALEPIFKEFGWRRMRVGVVNVIYL